MVSQSGLHNMDCNALIPGKKFSTESQMFPGQRRRQHTTIKLALANCPQSRTSLGFLCNNGAQSSTSPVKNDRQTLNANPFNAWATPGLESGSNRLPAFARRVMDAFGWPASMLATLKPDDVSTAVANERAMRRISRFDAALVASIVEKILVGC